MGPDEWHEMICVETVNAGANAVTLAPKATHVMEAHIIVASTK
jgi:glucose-6-phosphate 1-epimerase